ncbi:NXPE4 [Branchiostoma lanceolatum]|uniref:NXPE4 protein n=1 Tax=Branchiostoma lanceolatum TaxID=7740 RepID=A0A8K0A198_BRALA|nr:NXPE4 [Branchiostoma lanceolatum]
MTNLTWWQMLKRVLIGSVILTTGAEFLTTLMVRSSGWVLSSRYSHFSAPKPKAKVITVTSLGTWRTSKQSINPGWVTHPKYTSVKIINSKPTYHVGDTLVLEVIARDSNKRRKVYGGDYLRAVLRDKAQKASTTGRVRDHGNGRYTVSFLLSFPGRVKPQVQLIHPSEAVQLLKELREIPNKRRCDAGVSIDIKKTVGGANVVLVLSLCSHFTAEPKHVYSSRMYEVRSAIQEHHKKYPETTVIVKTCNTRHHRHYREVIQMSDWLADQLNQEMKGILGDLSVAILDVWDMTVSQWYAQDIHPDVHVVDNELNILMSYICPWMMKKYR